MKQIIGALLASTMIVVVAFSFSVAPTSVEARTVCEQEYGVLVDAAMLYSRQQCAASYPNWDLICKSAYLSLMQANNAYLDCLEG